jgi:hypothetical protein
MPRFVILEHDHPFLHWDLMLETGDVLRAWRLLEQPAVGRTIQAEALGDHRLLYLDYEGPVSGNRGSVHRWDAGTFTWELDTPERVTVWLAGNRCRGLGILERTSENGWAFVQSRERHG